MSSVERKRLEAFSRVKAGELTLVEASGLLQLGYRQTRRVWQRYKLTGDVGLVHRARGRASNRQPEESQKERAMALYRERYADYGPTLAAEILAKEDGVKVSVSALRRWLLAAGLGERRRKRRVHRRRRERRAHVGELLQLDGSHHDWFEGRRQVASPEVMYAGWAVALRSPSPPPLAYPLNPRDISNGRKQRTFLMVDDTFVIPRPGHLRTRNLKWFSGPLLGR
jgi:transposase